MFGLFKRKRDTHSVTQADKDWIEKNIMWFIEVFGLDHLEQSPFILPIRNNFPFDDLSDETQFQNLFSRICTYWQVDPDKIIVKFFDDIHSKQWSTWVYAQNNTAPAGLFNQIYTTDEKRFKIELAKSTLFNPELLINVTAHELAHVKLLGGNFVKANDPDMEPLTDLACIYFGFGLFLANTSVINHDNSLFTKTGYLPSEVIGYTNALLCFITGKNCDDYSPYLNQNTNEIFISDFQYLQKTNDTLLDRAQVEKNIAVYKNNRLVDTAFKEKRFEQAEGAIRNLIAINPKDFTLYNQLGYALLQQKKYAAAIIEFTKAIDIEPYWDYPYNNRGYCKLQLHDYENAFADLHSSFEMNPANSFSLRNLGVYYLFTGHLSKALEYFEQAEKTDPETEMINFYLSKTHNKLGDIDKAKFYSDKSKEKNEYNDSIIG